MMLFFTTIVLWTLILFFVRPKPSDLQEKIPGYLQSFKGIQATFWLGVFLMATFFIFSDGTFDKLNQDSFIIFGLNNLALFTPWWFVQSITHNFIHVNLHHLLTNLGFLALLSLYERKVTSKRFLAVFLFSGILSSISVLFVPYPLITAGASAGLLGLAAAYLLDNPEFTLKEYLLGVGAILILFLILSYSESGKTVDLFEIDTLGHLFGLLFGALFCKVFKRNAGFTGQ